MNPADPVIRQAVVENVVVESLRDTLRAIPSIIGRAPDLDWRSVPQSPREFFVRWLREALDAGVPEAHAATLSTVDADGLPDARVLVLKDVTEACGFAIATGDESAKGQQLGQNPKCALTFYWTPLARAVRIRGVAHRASDAEAAADFLARHPRARAIALSGKQSDVLIDEPGRDALVAHAEAEIDVQPGLVSPHWSVWTVDPLSIEFWQGAQDRNHQRLRYMRTPEGWMRQRLCA